MALASIVAMNHERVIGVDGDLPWRLPADLAFFRKITMGHAVLMGRKTFESLGSRPLPGRRNYVLSTTLDVATEGVQVVASFEQALAEADPTGDVVVIGGAKLYQLAMSHIDTLHVTLVDNHMVGDVYFPYTLAQIRSMGWRQTRAEVHKIDARHAYDFVCYSFVRS